MIDKDNCCDVCKGHGRFLNRPCIYCNETGEWNSSAHTYYQNHICQCIWFDRANCPVCEKSCHHNTPLSPKQKIDPGYGGTPGGLKKLKGKNKNKNKPKKEMEIIV